MKEMTGSVSILDYERKISKYRSEFSDLPFLKKLLSKNEDSRKIVLFFIHYCALGVHITEPVESWIKRAGESTIRSGYKNLGENLIKHARHEANHDKMMVNDVRELVAYWNRNEDYKLQENHFRSLPLSRPAKEYIQLHENVINSKTPYAQIAVEYEIEMLSVSVGINLLNNITEIFGSNLDRCLSFLKDHSVIDVIHTEFNKKTLSNFIFESPESLISLVEYGAAALDIYGRYLQDCWDLATKKLDSITFSELSETTL